MANVSYITIQQAYKRRLNKIFNKTLCSRRVAAINFTSRHEIFNILKKIGRHKENYIPSSFTSTILSIERIRLSTESFFETNFFLSLKRKREGTFFILGKTSFHLGPRNKRTNIASSPRSQVSKRASPSSPSWNCASPPKATARHAVHRARASEI